MEALFIYGGFVVGTALAIWSGTRRST